MPRKVDSLAIETLAKGHFRLDRHRLRFERYDGTMSAVVEREMFERGHAVAVLPYDPVRDRVVLIEQFRPGAWAAGRADPWLVEIVAGIVEPGEALADVARRETLEETGLTAGRLQFCLDYCVSPGGTSETTSLFMAEIDSAAAGTSGGLETEAEDIRVWVEDASAAIARADANGVDSALALVGLLWLARHREALRAAWRAGEDFPGPSPKMSRAGAATSR